ncbi:hypothetical protein [Deinococcus apachensis]|uniref:hypothetical protein n=1 Tax=Deinococcus apachensis TaxID=309886 RepID=UPI00036B0ECD|nr:hypothetical protein [Deinococcus apachensis]
MALFGDLEHHALTDLVRVLRAQSGTLFFHEAYQRRTVELTLAQGRLRAMYLDGFPIQEQTQVRGILSQLQAQGRGAFEFQRRDPSQVPGLYDLPLGELLEAPNEAAIPADQLPHPETRFVPARAAQAVPPSLAADWALLRPLLTFGASGAELARRVGRPEREILAVLHRLRAADLIAPQRAAAQAQAGTTPESVPAAPPAAPLVQRLLGALRRLSGRAVTA